MTEAHTLHELCGRLRATHRRLLCRPSFEGRSVSLAKGLAEFEKTAFASVRRDPSAERHLAEIRDGRPLEVRELDTSNPLQSAVAMSEAIHELNRAGGLDDVVMDVSTFRREELLMLLAILKEVDGAASSRCALAYVAAADMTPPLSGQVKRVRSVIGYAGETKPASPTLLVMMMGFETHRAASIIEAYEPAQLLLGKPGPEQSINAAMHEKNQRFFRELQSRSANQIGEFTFSAKDPMGVAEALESELSGAQGWNVVIAPLNTKLSTLGAGIYALRNPSVQVCYTEVVSYNTQSYSVAADEAYEIALAPLLRATLQEGLRQVGEAPTAEHAATTDAAAA